MATPSVVPENHKVDESAIAKYQERWRMATTGVIKFAGGNGHYSHDMSKPWVRLNDSLERLATLMLEDCHPDVVERQQDALDDVTSRLLEHIEGALITWAIETEQGRFVEVVA